MTSRCDRGCSLERCARCDFPVCPQCDPFVCLCPETQLRRLLAGEDVDIHGLALELGLFEEEFDVLWLAPSRDEIEVSASRYHDDEGWVTLWFGARTANDAIRERNNE